MAISLLRLEELKNYNSLLQYKTRLRETIKKFDYVYVNNKADKRLGTLKVALKELVVILENIMELTKINNMLVKTRPFKPSKEDVAENKPAAKTIKNIDEIYHDVREEIRKLEEQFFKQMELCDRLNNKVRHKIPYSREEDSEYQQYRKNAAEFETICGHSLMHKTEVPFRQEQLSIMDRNEAKQGHDEKSAKIDEIYSFRKEQENNLEQALNVLAITLDTPATYSERQNLGLQSEIRKEVAEIKNALPPKILAISKEALDKLRASDQLMLDLETIQSLLKNPTLTGEKYWKYNDKIEEIKDLIEQALKVEKQRKQDLKDKKDAVEEKKDYATSAVKTYNEILTNNQRLQQDQIRIRNGQYSLQAENENEIYMADKMSEMAVSSLPEEYTNMKKRLQSMSPLYQMQMLQSSKLTNGGMSK